MELTIRTNWLRKAHFLSRSRDPHGGSQGRVPKCERVVRGWTGGGTCSGWYRSYAVSAIIIPQKKCLSLSFAG